MPTPFNWSFGSVPVKRTTDAPDLGTRFEIHGELGRGAMGVVYRAHDRQLGRDVAVKTLAPGIDGSALERMWREARAAAALRHPGIVVVHECIELPTGPCLVQELIEGARPLSEVLESGLALDARVRLIRDVVQAMSHAHQQGVVHRDLKPENILIDAAGRARVSDFGLAWHADARSLTATNALLGTPLYMAPEQFGLVDGASRGPTLDVWGSEADSTRSRGTTSD